MLLVLVVLIDLLIFFYVPERETDQKPTTNFTQDMVPEKDTAKVFNDVAEPPMIMPDGQDPPDQLDEKELGSEGEMIERQEPKPSSEEKELTIIVPEHIPLKQHTYTVKQGDTLWHISGKFTGNPYNYPFVAKENEIPDPDLIYPKQKIILKRVPEE